MSGVEVPALHRLLGWTVLTGLFVAELAALAAIVVWGRSAGGWALGLGAATVAAAAWGLFASPKATFPHPVTRALVKTVVLGGAVLGLWVAGHHGWAVLLGVGVVTVQSLSLLPSVRSVDPRDF